MNKKSLDETIKKMVQKELLKEASSNYARRTGEFEVGDTVGNTVQGFDFEVLKIERDKVTVKNVNTGETDVYYIHNFYKRNNQTK